ncbi:hypothetical protein [Scytonema sp. PRP1]|uniref:hypothetical protein n=1 Tax=Scytonema sp. PRP1 TaxID=3120513 RepID=UPI002FD56DE4
MLLTLTNFKIRVVTQTRKHRYLEVARVGVGAIIVIALITYGRLLDVLSNTTD